MGWSRGRGVLEEDGGARGGGGVQTAGAAGCADGRRGAGDRGAAAQFGAAPLGRESGGAAPDWQLRPVWMDSAADLVVARSWQRGQPAPGLAAWMHAQQGRVAGPLLAPSFCCVWMHL
jgi:hypothetical protein